MTTLPTATTAIERMWRCPECGDEKPFDAPFSKASRPRWCLGENGSHQRVPTPMALVERERVYASPAERAIIENFEVSDWGLLEQAVRHYGENRRRGARKRPGVERVMRGVFNRFAALERACRSMRRYALPDTKDDEGSGGHIAWRWPSELDEEERRG